MRVWAALCVVAATAAAVVLSAEGPRLPRGLDRHRPVPATNPLTPGKIALGRRLFHERRLSRDGSLSCATCHDPRRAFADDQSVAVGIAGARGRRNVPTIINRAWGRRFLWDGRADTLERQVLRPLLDAREMGSTPHSVLAVVRSERYREAFERVFDGSSSLDTVADALATYVRTIVSGDSPYDRYADGRRTALSASAERGLHLFVGRAGCSTCHVGPTFSDEQFHNTGVAWRSAAIGAGAASTGGRGTAVGFFDPGRGAVTAAVEDRGAFKTPTLREVARTAPYMHDGSFATLDDVVDYYNRGAYANPGLDQRLQPLGLSRQARLELVSFLKSLSGRIADGY